MRRAAVVIAAAAVLLAGCGGSSPSSATHTQTHRVAPLHVLDHRTAKQLLAWVGRLTNCYRERELSPARAVVTRRMVTIDTDPSVPASILTGETLSCASGLGKPPAHASFRTRRGRTIVLLPPGRALTAP